MGISTTKIDGDANGKAFATLRFAGHDLDSDDIAAILPVRPTRSLRKGEEFFAGPRAGTLRGRTGVWFLSTDALMQSDDLTDHLRLLACLLSPLDDGQRAERLRSILRRAHARAHVTCFWHGGPGESAPQIPDWFESAVRPLAADIETDFAVAKSP